SAMGGSTGVLANVTFTRIMLGGNIVVLLLFLVNAVFRGAGDAAIAMRVLWLANAINIFLGPMLILGVGPFPRLGVVGAAVATTIGRGTGAIYAITRLFRPGARVRVHAHHFKLDPPLMWQMVQLSGSGTFQILVGSASWIALVRIISNFGSTALAGYTIAMRVIMFALLPSWGVSNAAATMVGQALGARKPDRAERAVWIAAKYNVWFLGSVGLIFVLLAGPIASLFTPEAAVARYAVAGLRTVAFGFPFYAFGMVLNSAFNGAGDTWTPTWINLFVFWAWGIPLAYLLGIGVNRGPGGVFFSMLLTYSIHALVSAWLFRKGRWKSSRV
ncbi:MAG TPA: MATE family efflux transporter, partial [Gemmatimonadaceae bacterium]|nr:MATE family efflux transporter [Gemmatimonadaceae bacterium]